VSGAHGTKEGYAEHLATGTRACDACVLAAFPAAPGRDLASAADAELDRVEALWGDGPQQLTRRQERMEMLASLRLWHGDATEPPPGYVTTRQAAEQLGVTPRTIERYKRELTDRKTP